MKVGPHRLELMIEASKHLGTMHEKHWLQQP